MPSARALLGTFVGVFTLVAAPVGAVQPEVTVVHPVQTAADIGYGQGIARRGEFLYLYGDGATGVIREFRVLVGSSSEAARLEWTGREIALTVRGKDVVPHPTGVTFHPDHGAFLGNTFLQKGTIFHIDWERALDEGTLDSAILNVVEDDAAINGCRPEFVRVGGRWLVATSDYGNEGNQLRLYDPETLATATRTSDPGVLVGSFECGPFVQTLCWLEERETLVFVQNVTPGRGYRLTFATFDGAGALEMGERVDIPELGGELEGAAPLGALGGAGLDSESWVLLEARPTENVRVVEIRWD